jgi:mRNA interferase MazF
MNVTKSLTDTPYRQGDIVYVDFPYSEGGTSKSRPVVIVSTDDYHSGRDDYIVVAITSRPPSSPRVTDYELQDWLSEGLNRPSWVRSKLYTVNRARFERKVGALTERDLQGVKRCLAKALGLW